VNNHGGKREGAGRPKLAPSDKKNYKTISICGTENEIMEIRQMAEQEKKTVSRFILDKLLK